jgi:hypothetical protein
MPDLVRVVQSRELFGGSGYSVSHSFPYNLPPKTKEPPILLGVIRGEKLNGKDGELETLPTPWLTELRMLGAKTLKLPGMELTILDHDNSLVLYNEARPSASRDSDAFNIASLVNEETGTGLMLQYIFGVACITGDKVVHVAHTQAYIPGAKETIWALYGTADVWARAIGQKEISPVFNQRLAAITKNNESVTFGDKTTHSIVAREPFLFLTQTSSGIVHDLTGGTPIAEICKRPFRERYSDYLAKFGKNI